MRIDRILVPLDGSKLAEQALPLAESFARAADASVHIIAVVPELTLYDVAGVAAALSRELERALSSMGSYVEERVAALRSAGLRATGGVVMDVPEAGIIEAATATNADLIVMTSHGSGGLVRLWLGSVTDAVVRRAPVPVLVLRPEDQLRHGNLKEMPITRILVPLDGSWAAESALEPALAIASTVGASLTLFLVVEGAPLISPELGPALFYDPALLAHQHESATRYLDRVAARVRARGVDVATVSSDGVPVAFAITGYARSNKIDLIVMGSHGRGGMRRLVMGSVADKVMRQADVPVLVARAAIGSSPADHHEDWQRQLAAFSERNRDRLVDIDAESPAFGSQREVDRLALQSVHYDWREDRLSVALRCGEDGRLVHRIGRPTRIEFHQDARGEVLSIRSPEGQMLLHVVSDGTAMPLRADAGAMSRLDSPPLPLASPNRVFRELARPLTRL